MALDLARRDRAALVLAHVTSPPAMVLEDSFISARTFHAMQPAERGDAARRRADLVVIGSHGRTGLTRLVLGSVAARVLALARCPVLTVRRAVPGR